MVVTTAAVAAAAAVAAVAAPAPASGVGGLPGGVHQQQEAVREKRNVHALQILRRIRCKLEGRAPGAVGYDGGDAGSVAGSGKLSVADQACGVCPVFGFSQMRS